MTIDVQEERDQALADLLDSWMAAPSADRPSLEALCRLHPELADDLRGLWGAVMVVDALAANAPHIEAADTTLPHPASQMRHEAPPRILGDFELIEEIGRGGMGIVYRARQRSLGREVAVKVMISGARATPADQARFQSEAAAAARLDHPSIVPIYETGEVEGWRYIGMKLIAGKTLAMRLAEGPMPQREAAQLVSCVAAAIAYAHRVGVVHRDLKPANILIDDEGMPHVSDFGLAKCEFSGDSLTKTGAILGTPSYMAPEQAAGNRGEVGPSSDLFSLGAILYALLTGRPPFQGASPIDTMFALLEQDPPLPRLLNPQIHRDLEMVVLRCLQKPAELRYPAVDDLADDLRAFLSGEPVSARSGKLSQIVARLFRETHHATVLENWGMLWMWHAVLLSALCFVTNYLHLQRDAWPQLQQHAPYVVLWGGGLALWAPIFWALRRRAGPVTAVERQIAHAWGGSMLAVMLLFAVEWILGMEVLQLSPVLGLISGMVFFDKAGILAGAFYIHGVAQMACALVMAWMQRESIPYGIALFGVVASISFFVPGLKYYRQSRRGKQRVRAHSVESRSS